MAFVAPTLVEGAAAGGSAAAASGAAEAGTAGAGRAATRGATSARTARTAPAVPSKTAAARADELTSSGMTRTQARRTLRHEYGATAEQADDLLDAAGGRQPSPPPADDKPADEPSGSGSSAGAQHSSSGSLPDVAGGGLLLGVLTYVLALVFLRGGWAGVRAWAAAKFLNRTSSAPMNTSTFVPPAPPYQGAMQARPGKPTVS